MKEILIWKKIHLEIGWLGFWLDLAVIPNSKIFCLKSKILLGGFYNSEHAFNLQHFDTKLDYSP